MPETPGNILFICTANTCRSPMAAALFRHALAAADGPLKSLRVASAGVSALDGYPAAANAVQAMKKVGLSLADHRSRRLTQEMLDSALVVFCMTEGHGVMVELQFDPSPAPVHLMRAFMDTTERDIPDPFGSNLQAYESCRDSMVEAIPSLLQYTGTLLDKRDS